MGAVRSRTSQRIQMVVDELQAAQCPVTYEELHVRTGASYDSLTYIISTLEVVGQVRRSRMGTSRGRPREGFEWVIYELT